MGIELLGLQLRLVVCSLDRAEEVGLDWWRNDSFLRGKQPRWGALPMPESGRPKHDAKDEQGGPRKGKHGHPPTRSSRRAPKRGRRRPR